MTLHAKTCCYSTLTTPLSILDGLGVVWFAARPQRVDLKNRVEFAHLLMRTDGRLRVLTVCDHFTFRENPLHFRLAVLCLL